MVFRFGAVMLLMLTLMQVPQAVAGEAADPLQQSVERGKQLFMHETFGGTGRTCNSCHRAGGRAAGMLPDGQRIPSLTNAAAIFPRFNPRRKAVLTLQNQIHNCVAGGLQGTPPAYDSRAMVDLSSYLTSLAAGKPIDMGGRAR